MAVENLERTPKGPPGRRLPVIVLAAPPPPG